MALPTDWYFILTITDTRSNIQNPPPGDPNQNPNPQPGSNTTVQALLHLYQSLSSANYGGTIGLRSAPLDLHPVYWPVYVSYNANGPSPNIAIVGRGINTFLKKKMGLNLDGGPTNPPPPPYSLQLVGDWDGSTTLGSSGTSGSGAWMSGQWLNWAENGAAPPPASSTIPATTSWYFLTLWDARPNKNRYIIVPFMLSSSSLATPATVNYGVMGLPGLSTPPSTWPGYTGPTYWGTNQFVANANASGYQFQVEGPSAYLAAALGITIPANARFQFWAQQASASAAPQGTATVPTQWLDSTALAALWTSGTPPTITGGPANNNVVWTTAVDASFGSWQ